VRQKAALVWVPGREELRRGVAALSPTRVQIAAACGILAGLAAGIATDRFALAGLAALALGAGLVAQAHPVLLGPLVALALPAGQATETLGVQVAPLDAVAGGGAIGYLASVAAGRASLALRGSSWLYLAFVACVAVSTFGPVDDGERIRTLLVLAALGVAFHAVSSDVARPRGRRLLLAGLAVAALVEAAVALYEYVDRWSDRYDLRDGAIVYPLPQATLGHANALAQFLVLACLALAALASPERGVARRLGLAVSGIAALALLVTFSRGAWIALSLGVIVYALDRRLRRRVMLGVAVVLAVGAALTFASDGAVAARIGSLFSSDTTSASNFRVELVERGIDTALDHPLTGTGTFHEFGVYAGRTDVATHPHNLLLGLAVFFGIPTALAFAALLVYALRRAGRGVRRQSRPAIASLAVLAALLVNGLFEYPFWSPSLTALIVLVLGMAIGLSGDVRAGSPAVSTGDSA
jgi:O-antigen ligase